MSDHFNIELNYNEKQNAKDQKKSSKTKVTHWVKQSEWLRRTAMTQSNGFFWSKYVGLKDNCGLRYDN